MNSVLIVLLLATVAVAIEVQTFVGTHTICRNSAYPNGKKAKVSTVAYHLDSLLQQINEQHCCCLYFVQELSLYACANY